MQIQVNIDSSVAAREGVVEHVTATIEARLARFGDYLTRVEVHLADESAGRSTVGDQRCRIEARPAGRQPVAVTSHASTVDAALTAAIGKLTAILKREIDRRDDHKGSASIRTAPGEDSPEATVGAGDANAAGGS